MKQARPYPLLTLLVVLLASPSPRDARAQTASATRADQGPRLLDFTDPTYGGRIRQLYDPRGDEHNLYHYR